MAEMDIYMRRRLVALGGLFLFFILFVLLVKSCGGDDEPEPVAEVPTGATGEAGGALPLEEYILQADAICDTANSAVGALDPEDPDATQDEFNITSEELAQLQSLQLAEDSADIDRFLSDLSAVVDALRQKARAVRADDLAGQDAAQLDIDTAEVDAREQGERAGFEACGQFLDAGEEPGGDGNADTAVSPTDSGTVAPATPITPAPAEPTTPTTPPATPPPDDGGGGTGGGGVTP